MRHDQIALQLYTVRRLMADDLPGTLRTVAGLGYRSVEIAGVPDGARGEFPALLVRAGLDAVASHESLGRMRAGVPALADWLDAAGCTLAIVPSLPEEQRRTVEDVRVVAADLNAIAVQLADRGIRLGYHNHAFEFAPLGDTTAWDVLLAELDPEIEIELDVYWASVGGRDPVEVIREAEGRVRLLHMKDRTAGPEPHDAPAGEGTLDFPGIVQAAQAVGVDWYIAEQDDSREEVKDIATAYRYLDALARDP